jgi:hypothetical protein
MVVTTKNKLNTTFLEVLRNSRSGSEESNRGLILMEEEAARQRLKRRPRGVALASGGLGG